MLSSSCDLVPGRTAHASFLRILPIRKDEDRGKEKLGTLLKFSRRDSMYLPALPDDTEEVVGDVISFEGICQIRPSDLFLANRRLIVCSRVAHLCFLHPNCDGAR
jgi:hypothetical protein